MLSSMRMKTVAILLAALMLTSMANADLCSDLYSIPSQITNGNNLTSAATYTGLLSLSLLIIMAVLSVLGFAYAIGYALRIDKITSYAKTEILESVANLIIIAAVLGTATIAFSGILFILHIAYFGMSSIASSSTSSFTMAQPPEFTNAYGFYTSLCENVGSTFGTFVTNTIEGILLLGIFNTLGALNLNVMPNGFGISLQPLAGLMPISIILSNFFLLNVGLYILTLFVVFLTFVIYYLFPIFLYLGIILRSFPWTRAAGGALLALFISFYIIFPAILYPFTLVSFSGGEQIPFQISPFSGLANAFGTLGFGILNTIIPGFIGAVSGYIFIIIGVAIAFLIAYDTLEGFASLLGAPSFRGRGSKLFQKLI